MNKMFAILGFLLISISIWVLILSSASAPKCPKNLDQSYYTCSQDSDCYYNPLYGCINQKPLRCTIENSKDLEIKNDLSKILVCKCVNNSCKEVNIKRISQ